VSFPGVFGQPLALAHFGLLLFDQGRPVFVGPRVELGELVDLGEGKQFVRSQGMAHECAIWGRIS
jgi:hypothetical protein